MLKYLSRVRVEYNALDPRKAACVELLAQCISRRAKESNPACQVELQRLAEAGAAPRVVVTYVNGVEEAIDAAATPAQAIRQQILDRGRLLETEQMFREAGEPWPVLIPHHELHQPFPASSAGLGLSLCISPLVPNH
uniref:Large ribosomal subunit protein mL53 n=1 Tax=Ananas comosus var. bracteatus TaxID=296719 RepID=A0A6V7QWA8_ANACO